MKSIIIIGYSGHSYVICDIFESIISQKLIGYCENEEKVFNPYNLKYFGQETSELGLQNIRNNCYFIGIGRNFIRGKVQKNLQNTYNLYPINAIHKSAVISKMATLGKGIMVGVNVSINALATVGDGVICNTGCIIEHECIIGNFAHIAPGAVLAGNVSIGEQTFVGANSVIKQGIKIGKNVTIGAGTVVIKDIPDNVTVVGNPQRIIK
jgi:sugar O-acyltransferase (sialic acid O-acetyltransferase NeuD family)